MEARRRPTKTSGNHKQALQACDRRGISRAAWEARRGRRKLKTWTLVSRERRLHIFVIRRLLQCCGLRCVIHLLVGAGVTSVLFEFPFPPVAFPSPLVKFHSLGVCAVSIGGIGSERIPPLVRRAVVRDSSATPHDLISPSLTPNLLINGS